MSVGVGCNWYNGVKHWVTFMELNMIKQVLIFQIHHDLNWWLHPLFYNSELNKLIYLEMVGLGHICRLNKLLKYSIVTETRETPSPVLARQIIVQVERTHTRPPCPGYFIAHLIAQRLSPCWEWMKKFFTWVDCLPGSPRWMFMTDKILLSA